MACVFIELGIQGVEILQDMQTLELLDLGQELLAALELCVCVCGWKRMRECACMCVCFYMHESSRKIRKCAAK